MKSKYLNKNYCGYKVVSTYRMGTHTFYRLVNRRKRRVFLNDNQMARIARHETTIKKLGK